MKGFLLDTNIPSEMTRPHPQPSVTEWLDDADDDQLYFSVVSLGEVLKGVTVLPEGNRRRELQRWLDETLRPWFQGRILPVNEPIAERWGVLAGECQLKGRLFTNDVSVGQTIVLCRCQRSPKVADHKVRWSAPPK